MDSTLSCLSTLSGQLTSWLSSLYVGVLSVRLGGCYSSWWFSQLVLPQVNWLAGTFGLFHQTVAIVTDSAFVHCSLHTLEAHFRHFKV